MNATLRSQKIAKIIDDYSKGVYISSKGERIKLDKKLNKYNLKLLQEFKGELEKYTDIIAIESTTSDILHRIKIENNNNYKHGDARVMYNLMNVQDKSRNVYRFYCTALKTYEVSVKQIYDAFKSELDLSRERAERNKALAESLLDDYGLGSIRETIQRKTGKTYSDYVIEVGREYIEQHREECDLWYTDNHNRTEEEVKTSKRNYFKEKNDYIIDKIEQLMISDNPDFSFEGTISSELTDLIGARNVKRQAAKELKKKNRDIAKSNEKLDRLHSDNTLILHDIMKQPSDPLVKLSSNSVASEVYMKVEHLGGLVYYVAGYYGSKLCYVKAYKDKNNNNTVLGRTGVINGATFFTDKEQAEMTFKQATEHGLLSGVSDILMLNIGSNFITEQYKVLQSNPSAYRWFNEGKPEDWVKVAVNKLFVRLFPNACCAEIPDIKSIKVTYYEVIYNNSIYYVNMDEYGNVQLVENMEYTDVFPYSVNGNTYNLKELHNKIEREIKDKDGAEVKFYVMDINVKWWKERLQVAKTVSSLLNEYVAKVNSGVKMSVNDKYSHIAITSLTKAINESEAHEVYLVSRVTGNMDCFRIPNKDNGKVLRGVYYSSLNNYKQPSETMSVNSAIKYTSLGQAIEMRNKFVSGITVNRATSTPFVYRVRLKD